MLQAQCLYCDRLAPDFNPFDFIQPDEVGLSKILNWLLDPTGTHGQGSRFLHLFLEQLGLVWPSESHEWAKAETEVVITDGRLDILISSGKFHLAIENKPWAWKMPIWERYAGFDVTYTDEFPFKFRMEFQSSNYNRLIFGAYKNENSADDENIALSITNKMGPGTSNSDWIWYRYVSVQDQVFRIEGNWQTSPEMWVDIADETMAAKIFTVANRFRTALKPKEV
jgi:PD-(D/E)XK nuclease superfamily